MDNDGDVEEEQLRKDILQINQVLGDEDDEGDDSDTDFVIDERDTTQRANEELHLHELGGDQELCEEDTGFAETSDECSIQQLLLINQESQKNLQDLLARVQEELARNQAEQGKVSANPSDNEQKNFDLCVRRLFRSYFEDRAGRTPPHNHETIQKKEANMPNPFEGPRIKWKKDQEEKLAEGIKTDGLKRRLQPILNRQEVLEDKIDRLSVPKDLEKAYEEMRENRKKIVKIENLPDSEFVGDRFRDVDWECIASVDFDGERTGEECQLHWQNHLYPTINHETWEETEMKDLLKVAAEHEHRDWAEIAEALGTGRTAMQCLSMYQQLDDTFVNPIFSKDDDELLHELVRRFQMGNKHIPFAKVAYFMEGKTQHQVTCRWVKTADPDIKFGKWSKEELNKFHKMVERYGARNWSRLAEEFPGRTQYQLRQRWANLSAPDIKHGPWDYQETIRFLKKAQEIGIGKWAVIADALKVPGEKRRTSPALLLRFKLVVESYLNWKSRTNPEENNNLGADDLYSGTFLPGLIAFIEMREKQKAALGPSLVYRDHRAKGHRARRRREEDGEDEDDESDDLDNIEEQTQPVCITARQKALAQKKSLSVPASAAERTVDAEQGSGKTDDTSKEQPSERADSLDEDLPSADDQDEEEASPLDENSDKEDEVSCSSTRVVPSHTANLTNVYGPRGLARWLKKIHAANAARAAQVAAKSKRKEQERKQERTRQKMDKSTFQASEKSTFDVQTSMIYVNHKRCGGPGRKPLTSTDHQLFQAVDPMWLCRNGNSGRPTRRTAQAQERTRQEKLCRDDQRAMFGLLLKVFDVDLNFTTAIARRNLAKSKVADKKGKEDSVENVSRDQTTGTGNLPASSGSRIDTTGPTREIVRMPQGLTSGTQVLNTGPQGVMNRTPGVPVGPQEVPVGPQGVPVGPQEVPVGPQGVPVGPQEVPVGPQGVPVGPQEVTVGPQAVTVGPQTVAVSPQAVAVGPQGVTVGPQGVTVSPQGVTVSPQGGNVGPPGVTVGPQGVPVGPQTVAVGPQAVAVGPQGVAVGPQGVSLQGGNVGPQGLTVGPQGVPVGSQGVTVGVQGVNIGPQVLTAGPQVVAVGPQGVPVGSQGVTAGFQGLDIGPQRVTSGSEGVIVGPQVATPGPQGMAVGPQGVTTGQGVIVGPQGVVVGPQTLPIGPQGVNTSLQEVTTGSQGVTVSPQGVTTQGSDVEETTCTSDGEWMTVKQQLKLKRSKEARSAVPICLTTICQNGQNTNAAAALNSNCNAGLNQNNQLGLKPVPQHPQQPQSQLLLLRNNLTGQLVLVKGYAPSAVTHPNTAGAAPQIQPQSTLIPGSSSAVQVDTQNQGGSCLIQPSVPHQMHPPQSVQTAPVLAFGSPVRSAQVLGQQGASPVVISNPPNPLMVGVQGGTAPVMSFFTLPQQPVPRDGLGNVQVPAPQVQPVMNVVVANSQQSQDQATLKLQVPQQANSPLPSGLTVTQPALRQTSPVVSDSAVCSESSKFVELPLRDGSKFALTLDQYKMFKAGKLGDVSCPLLTPTRKVEEKQPDAVSSQSEKTVAQQLNNEQGPKQTQSGEVQERERSKSPVPNLDPSGFSSPGRSSKSKKWKPLKRKLHTQDISLLPPNVATLQALTSLLLDRKNLEKQRDLFIAKFERQVKKQQEDKRGSACFKGYLESRNTAQVESSQGSKSTGTPQKAYPNGCMSQDSDTDASSHRLSSDSSIPSYSSSPKAKDPQQSVSSQILEGQMDALRKSDLYQVLLKRFLSLFLWPGLLSSTRIRGSLSTTSQTSYITDQPFVMTGTSKPCTASNPEKAQKEAPPTSKEASVGTKNKKATTSKVGNQTEIDDVNLVCTKETEVNRSQEETMETATASRCHSDEKRANFKVTASGLKRKAADAMSACNGQEQDTNGKGNSDAADGLRHKKRRAAVCGAGDATV